ncbi:bifunctional diguanylate cyclase/phosphodiesterase [Brucella sp. BE17]|uniref:putative bifunctional diguanylate cyclase/phosphodiesterase n=1 Tax=Brucella sp. BE17 TaxID=3142977 RepID=UPI0031BA590D
MSEYALHDFVVFLKRVEPLAAKMSSSCAILSIDIDRFRRLSLSLGTDDVDMLFLQLVRRLKHEIRSHDILARTGRDGFVIFVNGTTSKNSVIKLCKRLLATVHEPFLLKSREVLIKLSIGVSYQDAKPLPVKELVRRADVALQFQKVSGGSNFNTFKASLDKELKRQQTIADDLATALESKDQIVVHYQPLFSRRDLTLVGHEALVRWRHPTDGWLSPAEFLPQAEATGLINQLGQHVLEAAARVARHRPGEFVAVNVSPQQCRVASFAEQAEASVRSFGCSPEQFELELTEHIMMDDEQSALTVRDLRKRGFRIVLDDFGSGYCSIAYLRRFMIDKLKIDRQFIVNIDEDEKSIKIVRGIIGLAHALDIQVTAEGIETQRQLSLMQETDCDELQGFLLGKPVPLKPEGQGIQI